MAYVTPIGSAPEQVEYRLAGAHGCTRPEAAEAQFSYHADGRERPLIWTGSGLAEVGLTAGTVLGDEQFDAARALMAGLDPRTGERLVEAKLAVYEDAKMPLAPLVRAVQAVAVERGVEPAELFTSAKLAKAYERAVRGVDRSGGGAALRADEAGRLADAAGVDIDQVWGRQTFAVAVGNLTETQLVTDADGSTTEQVVPRRKVVGNLGYDVSFTLPKSHSLLLAFASDDTAAAVEGVYTAQIGATFDWLEEQTAYGMRGKHGDGRTADTVRGSGFLGWSMVHRAARPVGDRVVGDPHWHVHVTIANMTRGQDGQWSTVAAGGRDLMRHAPAADHVLKALIRRQLVEEFGVEFTRSARTGAWEVAAIPDTTLRAFSKRGASIEAMLRDLGFDPTLATRKAEDLAAAQTRHDKTHATTAPDATLRSLWQQEARELGVDPDRIATQALPLAGPAPRQVLADADLAMVIARLLDPEKGLTSSMRRFTRVDALAAVADAMPNGAADVQEIEQLTDRALVDAGIVLLPEPVGIGAAHSPRTGAVQVPAAEQLDDTVCETHATVPAGERRQLAAGHMRNAQRFTTADVVAAEAVILELAAGSRQGQGLAHVAPATATMARSAVEVGQGFSLSAEQAGIVEQLVTSDRQLDAVLGPPGTGKTTLMRAARAAWESDGHVVAGAATAAVAAQNLATESGIASKTVAQWVWSIRDGVDARECVAAGYVPADGDGSLGDDERRKVDRAAQLGGLVGVDVLVLDEANLTDDRDRAVLYTEALRTGTKLVEVGDPKQLRGVGCGSLFGRVHELIGGAVLTDNRRQSDQDERAAIAAWRDGRYGPALTSWSKRGRLIATETGDQALTAMVATWMTQRDGAPDPHTEIRGVVMLAASNETVDRLNDAAQAVRAASRELGPERSYDIKAGRSVRLRPGDHVLIRLNDRTQRMHEGPDVLNGYRGIVESIDSDAAVHVAWQIQTDDGHQTQRAALSADFIAKGGVSLGYAMTGHKAEGLTVAADWTQPDGTHQGGTVLVYGPGMDEPGMHVATSRHKDRMFVFAGREQVETGNQTYEEGVPRTAEISTQRVIAAMAEHAKTHSDNANDKPVHDDLSQSPQRPAAPTPAAEPPTPAAAWRELRAQHSKPDRATDPPPETPATTAEEREMAARWDTITKRRNAPSTARPGPGGSSKEAKDLQEETRRREATRRADDMRRYNETRRPDQGRGPRL